MSSIIARLHAVSDHLHARPKSFNTVMDAASLLEEAVKALEGARLFLDSEHCREWWKDNEAFQLARSDVRATLSKIKGEK